ncbi:MAG: carboxypeptidase regulatory-like domain-containing protein, partial [Bacteroidota bacterium]
MKKLYSLVLAIILFSLFANAQSQLGELRGKVIDAKTKKPMDFVSVGIFLNGILKATAVTDDEGNFLAKSLQPGGYEIKVSYIGYRNSTVQNIDVVSDKIRFQNVYMESNEGGKVLADVVVISKPPLIDPDGKQGKVVTSHDIQISPTRNLNMIANTVAGVEARAGGTPNFRGARADGTAYYIDGMRVNAGATLPTGAIDQVDILTGGIPAQFGDFIGGAISQTTKSPSRYFQKYFDYRTSTPFNGYLDNSQYNDLQLGVSGPIKIINKGKGDKERVLFGFAVSGEGTYARSGMVATDIYKVSDDVLKNLEAKPLVRASNGAFVNSAEFLTKNDLVKVPYTQNVAGQSFLLSGNFTYQPASNINVKLGYQANYSRGRSGSYSSSLMNYSSNPLSTSYTIRPYIQFTQMFNNKKTDEEAKKSLIANAYYTVRLSYERFYSHSENADFGDNIFNYGYVGQFKTYSTSIYTHVDKTYSQTGQQPDKYTYYNTKTGKNDTLYLTNYWKQEAQQFDTLTTFNQANINTVRGNYTKVIYDYFNQNNLRIRSLSDISALGGMRNGDEPLGIYSNMWTNVGTNLSGYGKSQNETYALYVMSEASVGTNPKRRHDLQFGFTYEQQIQRGYSLGAAGLWSLMRQLVNQQFAGNDSS